MKTRKFIALMVAMVLVMLPVLSNAEAIKNEILYATFNADGTNADYAVINRFDVDEAQTLTDYGTYSAVTNLTSEAPITINGDKLSMYADTGVFYYEGVPTNVELPWSISLLFVYNGDPVMPQDLAGKRGTVELRLSVRQNTKCEKDYFDHYALSISTTFDTANCTNIRTNGIVANVGKSKQVNFTVLPGNEEDLTITMYASQFAMSALTINGVPLSMDPGTIDTEDAKSDLGELESGAADLDDGASTLSDGVNDLEDGADALFTGSGQVNAAMRTLNSAASMLCYGNDLVIGGIQSLVDGAHELSAFNQQLKDGAAQITNGEAQQKLTEAEAKLTTGSAMLNDGVDELSAGVNGLANQVDGMGQRLISAAAYLSGVKSVILNGNGSVAGVNSAIVTLQKVIGDIGTANASIVDNTPGQSVKASLSDAQNELQSVLATLMLVQGALSGSSGGITFDDVISGLNDTGASLIKPNGTFYQQAARLESSINDPMRGLKASIQAYTSGVLEYVSNMQKLNRGAVALAKGTEAYVAGESALAAGIDSLQGQYGEMSDGVTSFAYGVQKLAQNYAALDLGVQELVDGIDELADGVTELTDGTFELRNRTTGASERVDAEVDRALEKFHNDDYTAASFTSAKNHPEQVQFVLKFRAVELPDDNKESTPEVATEQSPLERLMDLFR